MLFVAAVGGAVYYLASKDADSSPDPLSLSYEALTGSIFLAAPKDPFKAPGVREVSPPAVKGLGAVWGATGRDYRGHIWVGVSASGHDQCAHLYEYDPAADSWRAHGGVVDRMKAAGLYREGEDQAKIHSKIISAEDGWLYFASTDEEGEKEDGTQLPRWGARLWRIHPLRHTWEHIAHVPEGLVAASGVGRFVYALGYWGHILYQYDTARRSMRRVAVGSVGGHVSRNFLADVRGHAYVPRLTRRDGKITVALVEYDSDLKEVAATPLEFYLGKDEKVEKNHGIVGTAYLPDGRMIFVTHPGHLYLVERKAAGSATVRPVGWLHPDGKAEASSLFHMGGDTLIAGIVRRNNRLEWVMSDLSLGTGVAFPLDTKALKEVLLYGSLSRDNDGRAYVAGRTAAGRGESRPLILQIVPPP